MIASFPIPTTAGPMTRDQWMNAALASLVGIHAACEKSQDASVDVILAEAWKHCEDTPAGRAAMELARGQLKMAIKPTVIDVSAYWVIHQWATQIQLKPGPKI